MSTYGGDSWAREAECRKTRVSGLMREQINEGDYHRLCNGKYACLVCPNRPLVDTLPMLMMHNQGARHRAAALRLREKELSRNEEAQKRIALHGDFLPHGDALNGHLDCSVSFGSPLLRQTCKRTADALANRISAEGNAASSTGGDDKGFNSKRKYKPFFDSLHVKNVNSLVKKKADTTHRVQSLPGGAANQNAFVQDNAKGDGVAGCQQLLDVQKLREKELSFRAAGWRRDGNGGWFKQENRRFIVGEDAADSVGMNLKDDGWQAHEGKLGELIGYKIHPFEYLNVPSNKIFHEQTSSGSAPFVD